MTHLKKLVGLSAALMLTTWPVGTGLAAVPDTGKSGPTQTPEMGRTIVQTIDGTVSAVKAGTKTVEVTVPWGKADRLIPGARVTAIQEGKSSKNLANLKAGEHVRMQFVEHGRFHLGAKPIIIPLERHRG